MKISILIRWCIFYQRTTSASKYKHSFEGENIQTQYSKLGYRINLPFHDYKLATETVKNGYSVRNIDFEIKRPKTIEQQFGCLFIRIDSDKENVDIFKAINKILK